MFLFVHLTILKVLRLLAIQMKIRPEERYGLSLSGGVHFLI